MAPRKTKSVKNPKPKEAPERRASRQDSTSTIRSHHQICPLSPSEELANMMGDETDTSERSRDFSSQSRPNFSFLPSGNLSSPHRIRNIDFPPVQRLARLESVSNSDLVQHATSNEASPSNTGLELQPATNRRKTERPAKKTVEAKNQGRKQKTPKKFKILQEIVELQGTVHTLVPKLSFGRLIREVLAQFSRTELRVTNEMLQCLQEAAEIYAVQLFEDSYRCTLHRNRVTLLTKDMQLALMIRRDP